MNPDASRTPRYRILAVSEQTGIQTATLRAWERRYGVPEPARTDARYRLYSDQDVALLRRMAALCAAGLRPAEAARTARSETQSERSAPPLTLDAPPILEQLVAATQSMDTEALRIALDQAFATDHPAAAYDTFLSPALRRIGELWERGELTIAAEHMATHFFRARLVHHLRMSSPPLPAPTALLGCFDEEQHDLGLLGFALHVASYGYRPMVLGARTPPRAIGEAVALHGPQIVGLSVVVAPPPAEAKTLVAAYAKACADRPWFVGGPGVKAIEELVRKRGGLVAPASSTEFRGMIAHALQRKESS